jgi:hypothetical protein
VALLLLLASVVVLSAAISAAVVLIVGHGSWLTVYDAYTGNAIGCAWAITNGQWFGVLLLGLFALWAYELFYTIRFASEPRPPRRPAAPPPRSRRRATPPRR